jgi:REP element-mobilizing transposase RayT
MVLFARYSASFTSAIRGAIFHVTVRGNGRSDILILTDDSERNRLLERLAERVESFNIRLYLFVPMTNHLHLVFESPRANPCGFMQSLLTAYSVYFNLRHGRHGHVTERQYQAKLVEGDRYLLNLTRYVHLNPVFTKQTVKLPEQKRIELLRGYRWCSYQNYIGRRVAATLLCRYCSLTQRKAAEVLGLSTGTAVGYQIRTLRSQRSRDRQLDRLVARLQRDLGNKQRVSPCRAVCCFQV